jgi:hypothetical protein
MRGMRGPAAGRLAVAYAGLRDAEETMSHAAHDDRAAALAQAVAVVGPLLPDRRPRRGRRPPLGRLLDPPPGTTAARVAGNAVLLCDRRLRTEPDGALARAVPGLAPAGHAYVLGAEPADGSCDFRAYHRGRLVRRLAFSRARGVYLRVGSCRVRRASVGGAPDTRATVRCRSTRWNTHWRWSGWSSARRVGAPGQTIHPELARLPMVRFGGRTRLWSGRRARDTRDRRELRQEVGR